VKPRLAIVCPALDRGGAVANVAIHQAHELARSFHVCLVSQALPASSHPEIEFVRVKPRDFSVLRRFAHAPNEIAFALAARSALRKLQAQSPIAMVICHGHVVAATTARGLKREFDIPYALVTHGDIFDRPNGTYDSRLTYLYRKATPPAYRDADLVIALSPHMAALAAQGGARPKAIALVPNGIDPHEIGLNSADEFLPRPRSDVVELLYVGRLATEKGVDVLTDATALLNAEGVPFHLRIAGSGPLAAQLRAQVESRGLRERTEFIGPVARECLGALYRSADIVCVPSRSDPLPTVVLEAMCCGASIVGSDAGGIPFLLQQGEAGVIFPAGDAAALAHAIGQLARDPVLAHRVAAIAQVRARNEFGWTRIGERMGEAIHSTLRRTSMIAP
jgi:glycosyltransferase involved in cell wall biosynthesis